MEVRSAPLDVQLEETGRFGRKLSVTIPAAAVQATFEQVIKEVAKSVQLPGFRQGKVPRGLVEQQFGDRIRGEVRDRLVSGTLMRAMGDKNVAPLGMPQLSLGDLGKEATFSYTAEFEIPPDVKLTQVKGLKVPRLKVEVPAADVDQQLENMRKSAAQLAPVLIRDTVEAGDVVVVDYEGTMGGVPFKGGSAQGALIEIGGEGFLKAFSDGLVGARCPGERVIPVDFPADYGSSELAGKSATFKVVLKEIKKKELPALDDEFAKDVGAESLADLRKKVEDSLKAKKTQEAEQEERKKLLEALVAANPFELPESMIHEQADRMIAGATARIEQMVGRRFSLSDEEQKKLRDDTMGNAESSVRSGLLLVEVARAEKIAVEPGEVDAEIAVIARSMGAEAQRVESYYRDEERRERLQYRILEDKVVKFLLDNAERFAEPAA